MINSLCSIGNKIYNVAAYIRLSKEDINKNEESLSVRNQKMVLLSYIKEKKYNLFDIYIDDGYTGTNFDRPSFNRMISDIEDGKVNMVVTKDLSRLGRDYIATGEYVEKYFPLHNIRYVALLDGIDTFLDSSSNDIAPFKAVINDMYSKDNSKKIKSALKAMKEKGKWVGACTPLGYMKDPNDKNHLVINENESYIVKKIFNMLLSGMTCYQIKEKLTKDGIPTMTIIRNRCKNDVMARNGIWNAKTVKSILSNEVYIGNMVQNKRSRISYKIRKVIPNDKTRWIVVEKTHEPIISVDTFNKAKEILKKCKTRSKKDIYRLFDGLLYCADCKHKISICKPKKNNNITYMACNYYRMYSKEKVCSSHAFNYDILESELIEKLKSIIKNNLNKEDLYSKAIEIYDSLDINNDIASKIDNLDILINKKRDYLDKMYLDKLESKINDEMFYRISKSLNAEIDNMIKEKNELSFKINEGFNKNSVYKDCKKIVDNVINNVSRSTILNLIDKIEIHETKIVDIYFSFRALD